MTLDARCRAWRRVSRRGLRFARLAAPGLLVLAIGFVTISCSGDSRRPEARRRNVQSPDARPRVDTSRADTASLLTATREDSLIGRARGAPETTSLPYECIVCHSRSHGASIEVGTSESFVCVSCHVNSHRDVQSLYAGTITGSTVHPDTMYLARVSCVGCHVDSTFAVPAGHARREAYDGMCVSCHGVRFSGMVESWGAGLAWRERAVGAYLASASADARLDTRTASVRLESARGRVALLSAAGALHNVRGAHQLLGDALSLAASAYARAGLTAPPLPRLGPDPARNVCLTCHYGVDLKRATVFGEEFDHGAHVVRADVACSECHSETSYFVVGEDSASAGDRRVDARHGRTRLTAASCSGCHHSPSSPLACASCHEHDERIGRTRQVLMPLALRPKNSPSSRSVPFAHTVHSATACVTCHVTPQDVGQVVPCASCHEKHHREGATGCASCHGERILAPHSRGAHFACATCHERGPLSTLLPDRAFCLSCHVKQASHEPGRECAPCHLRLTPSEVRQRILAQPATSIKR